MIYFKKELEKRSDNRITVELFFSGILGKESEVLDMVKKGTIQGCRGGLFERANRKYIIYTLPFIFQNSSQMLKLLDSDFGKTINAEALSNGYYIPVCGIAGGLRNITTNTRPIHTPDDIAGMTLRTPPIDITIKTFDMLGAMPEQIPYTETYMALKNDIVDGQENPLSNIVDMKFYEVQKYLSLVSWQAHPDPFYVNPGWYNSLPDDLRRIFDDVSVETMTFSNQVWLDSENDFLQFLKSKMEINEVSPEHIGLFKAAVQPVWRRYIEEGYFTEEDLRKVREIISG